MEEQRSARPDVIFPADVRGINFYTPSSRSIAATANRAVNLLCVLSRKMKCYCLNPMPALHSW